MAEIRKLAAILAVDVSAGRDYQRNSARRFLDVGSTASNFVEQCLGLSQNRRVEPLCEPIVDRREQIAGLLTPALVAPRHIGL